MLLHPKKLFSYFNSNFELRKTSSNWWSFDNPFRDDEGKRNMAVHFQYEIVKCWVTGYKKSCADFIMDFAGVSFSGARDLVYACQDFDIDFKALQYNSTLDNIHATIDLPEHFIALSSGRGLLGDRARKYITDRGFDVAQLDRMGFGYVANSDSMYFGRIIIPFKSQGSLYYFIGRDFIGSPLRYLNPKSEDVGIVKKDCFYNVDALSLYDTVYITEGWSDALTLGDNAIASLGWHLSDNQKAKLMFSETKKLVFIPDIGTENGKTFYQKAAHQALYFENKSISIVDIRNVATGTQKDINDVGATLVKEEIERTPTLNFKDLMKITLN